VQELSSFWDRHKGKSFPKKQRIGFTDSADPRIIQAFLELAKTDHIEPFLIGDLESLASLKGEPALSAQSLLVPSSQEHKNMVELLTKKQERFKVSATDVESQLKDSLYQGIGFLLLNKLDGLISGSLRPTGDVVKAAIRCIGSQPGVKFISGQFFIESNVCQTQNQTPFLFADCAVIPEPSPRALATLAKGAADSYHFFTKQKPCVTFLSFSTRHSAHHPLVDRIQQARALFAKQNPAITVDGEMQVDAALDSVVAQIKGAGDSPVAGKTNVFIFPTLESGNIGYKLIQRFSKARIAGPLMWGLQKPMSDLSRGCNVQEILDTTECVHDWVVGIN